MKKTIRWILACLAVYLSIWLLFGAAIRYLQPEDGGTAVLTTFDSDGSAYQTIVRPVEDERGNIWILSGQWFRSWYNHALSFPTVELQRGETSLAYQATPVDNDDEIERVLDQRRGNTNTIGAFLYRALFLFAPVKVLELKPSP